MRKVYALIVILILAGFERSVCQSIVLNTGSPTYSQNFNSLSSTFSVTWTDNSTIPAWYAASSNLAANGLAISTGGSATGNLYNFGSASAVDRTLGSVASGGTGTLNYGVLISNGSSLPLISLRIQYTGEQWRNGGNTATQSLAFDYSTSSTTINSGTYTLVPALDFVSPIASATATGLDGNLPANRTSFDQTITGLTILPSGTIMLRWTDINDSGNDHGLGIDDITITATFGSSNTITTGTVSTTPFNLLDCFSTASGTVSFTSSGIFNAGNIYTAQLSSAVGSFGSPATIGTLTSTANSGTINITIPAGTPTGSGYKIRIVSDNPLVVGSESATFTINQAGTCVSAATDHFRTRASGNWNTSVTWESSTTGAAGTWINATTYPSSTANTITIRNGHTVTLNLSQSADQLTIQSGGTLVNNMASTNTFSITDGTGIDMDIQNGGMYQITSANGYAGYQSLDAGTTINIATGGVIRIGAGGTLGGGSQNSFVTTPTTYIWNDGSIFDWNTTSIPGGTGVTFFPDAGPATIPILRFTSAPGTDIGGGTALTVKGKLEANTPVFFNGLSDKIFRNGITGTGNVTLSNTVGKIIVNGVTAEFGGTGSIIPNANGLEIGPSTTATLSSAKALTGNVSLLTDTYVQLGNYDFTVSGTASNATLTSYFKTNGTGRLTLQGVGTGASGKLFPIGLTSINPLFIQSVTTSNYSARIVEPITPPIYNNAQSVLRTWFISSSVNTPTATISFGYSYPGDVGASFNNSGPNAEVGVNIGGTWNIHQQGITPSNFIIPGTFTVTPTLPINYFNNPATEFPFVVGNNGAILPLDYSIVAHAKKINNDGNISWDVLDNNGIQRFEVQRSVNNGAYETIAAINPGSSLHYAVNDRSLASGVITYRVKMIRLNGMIKYSNLVALINGSKGILITSIHPNPTTDISSITISSAKNAAVQFRLFSPSGQLIREWTAICREGNNEIPVSLQNLGGGIYSLEATSDNERSVVRIVKTL